MTNLLYTVEVQFTVNADAPEVVTEKLRDLQAIANVTNVKAKARKEDK